MSIIPKALSNTSFYSRARANKNKIVQFYNTVIARIGSGFGVKPLSTRWGHDRGFPIGRYYLESFLKEYAHLIKGDCLEFRDDAYSSRFGGKAVSRVDVLHLDDSNPKATIVADLTKPNDIESNRFDCIVCTHVLHMIFNLDKAMSELYRILKPGGVLIVGVPHISMNDPHIDEIWRFTPAGLKNTLTLQFQESNIKIKAYGNALSAAFALRGLVTHEMTKRELEFHDERFAVEVCAVATK